MSEGEAASQRRPRIDVLALLWVWSRETASDSLDSLRPVRITVLAPARTKAWAVAKPMPLVELETIVSV